MSEIRQELERVARELKLDKDDSPAKSAPKKAASGDKTPLKDSPADEYLTAPRSYQQKYAEAFASLSPEWRKYLYVREQEIERGLDDLRHRIDAYKWLEDAYAARSDELQNYGIKSSKEWLDNMIRMDTMLSRSPADAINILADVYHVGRQQPSFVAEAIRPQKSLSAALADQMVQKQVADFAAAQDTEGQPLHPFFREVIKDMYELLQKGVVNSLDDAYEAAVWFNATTRDKLIAKRSQEALELKSKDALKSKEAAFAPKGKADLDTRDLSLREELEMRFAALNGEL